jgi:hypothetical protein
VVGPVGAVRSSQTGDLPVSDQRAISNDRRIPGHNGVAGARGDGDGADLRGAELRRSELCRAGGAGLQQLRPFDVSGISERSLGPGKSRHEFRNSTGGDVSRSGRILRRRNDGPR